MSDCRPCPNHFYAVPRKRQQRTERAAWASTGQAAARTARPQLARPAWQPRCSSTAPSSQPTDLPAIRQRVPTALTALPHTSSSGRACVVTCGCRPQMQCSTAGADAPSCTDAAARSACGRGAAGDNVHVGTIAATVTSVITQHCQRQCPSRARRQTVCASCSYNAFFCL